MADVSFELKAKRLTAVMAALDALYAAQEAIGAALEEHEDMGSATEAVQGACFGLESATEEMRDALALINKQTTS